MSELLNCMAASETVRQEHKQHDILIVLILHACKLGLFSSWMVPRTMTNDIVWPILVILIISGKVEFNKSYREFILSLKQTSAAFPSFSLWDK